jgi:hypothetical protein
MEDNIQQDLQSVRSVVTPMLQDFYEKYLYNNTLSKEDNEKGTIEAEANCYGLSLRLEQDLRGKGVKNVQCIPSIKYNPFLPNTGRCNHVVVSIACSDGLVILETSSNTPTLFVQQHNEKISIQQIQKEQFQLVQKDEILKIFDRKSHYSWFANVSSIRI